MLAHPVEQLQNQRDGVLRHRSGAIGGNIANGDTAGLGRLQIDDIVARGEHPDHPQAGQGGEGFRVERDFIGEDDFSICCPFDHGVATMWRSLMEGRVAECLEKIPFGGVKGKCGSVEDGNIHDTGDR